MSNLAEKLPLRMPGAPKLSYGVVTERNGDVFAISSDSGIVAAQKAVSCVILPEPGDYVLLSVDAGARCYVLAVLQRDSERASGQNMVFDGPVNLHVAGGDLSLTSDRSVTMAANEDIVCAADRLDVQAEQAKARVGSLQLIGRVVKNQMERVVSVARFVENTFGQVTQRMKNSYRYVEEHDETQSNTTRQLVEESVTVQAKNAYHLTEEVVKIDAEQIHLG